MAVNIFVLTVISSENNGKTIHNYICRQIYKIQLLIGLLNYIRVDNRNIMYINFH